VTQKDKSVAWRISFSFLPPGSFSLPQGSVLKLFQGRENWQIYRNVLSVDFTGELGVAEAIPSGTAWQTAPSGV
jgi:hypothetical protein